MADESKSKDHTDVNFDALDATTEKAKSIQAIDKGSVHRICSGQVVLTLAIAVKELVENSVDAKASSVEVRLKEYGSEVIEVVDNGTGVQEKDFAALTLKHHTSKLQDFTDLVGVETFGFRGEALSSLCALSKLSVTTCHETVSVGTRLEFDNHGRICSQCATPRQRGTTVVLQNLFSTLPVRHREFQRNLKKEFAKMVQMLNAYCLVTTGVRISVSNQVGKGKRSTVVSTQGNANLRENISNIFGPKCVHSLLEFKQCDPTEEVCSWFNVKPQANTSHLFRLEGYVSKCEHGQGRSSSDRQFIFINSRPCDSPKVTKVINEVYHSYNRHQYPFIVLTINMDKESIDVNVTPDKRQIFLQGEKLLLATLKSSLVKLYEPTTSIMKVNSFLPVSIRVSRDENSSDTGSDRSCHVVPRSSKQTEKVERSSTLSKLKRSFSSAFDRDTTEHPQPSSPLAKQMKIESSTLLKQKSLPAKLSSDSSSPLSRFFAKRLENTSDCEVPHSPTWVSSPSSNASSVCRTSPSKHSPHLTSSSSHTTSPAKSNNVSLKVTNLNKHETDLLQDGSFLPESPLKSLQAQRPSENNSKVDNFLSSFKQNLIRPENDDEIIHSKSHCDKTSSGNNCTESDMYTVPDVIHHIKNVAKDSEDVNSSLEECRDDRSERSADEGGDEGGDEASHCVVPSLQPPLSPHEYDEKAEIKKTERTIPFSFHTFKERHRILKSQDTGIDSQGFSRTFRAKIAPTDNQSAEEELQREIKKDMFPKMDIIGQFNLGFILTKLGDDLFIVDQHATDEKYNFEMLQRHTVLHSQKLIHAQNLELTASNETILLDNLHIFNKNGFDFLVDESAPPTHRVKLCSAPVSKNWKFGKEDIEELIFMLTDSPGVMCRPSRVRMMFASRSCRKAVMIGTPLSKVEMRKLLCHMGEIEQPWNCPHGRPTMRHLFNLNMLPK